MDDKLNDLVNEWAKEEPNTSDISNRKGEFFGEFTGLSESVISPVVSKFNSALDRIGKHVTVITKQLDDHDEKSTRMFQLIVGDKQSGKANLLRDPSLVIEAAADRGNIRIFSTSSAEEPKEIKPKELSQEKLEKELITLIENQVKIR